MKLPVFKTLSEGFNLVKKRPVIIAPLLIASAISYFLQLISFNNAGRFDFSIVVLNLLGTVMSIFLYGLAIRISYAAATKKRISFENATQVTLERLIGLILSGILMGVIALAGFILLVIPGIFIAIKLAFYEFAIMIDNARIVESLKKSWKVTRSNWWRVFGLMLVMGLAIVPLVIFNFIFNVPSSFFASLVYYFLTALISAWYTASLTLAYMKLKR